MRKRRRTTSRPVTTPQSPAEDTLKEASPMNELAHDSSEAPPLRSEAADQISSTPGPDENAHDLSERLPLGSEGTVATNDEVEPDESVHDLFEALPLRPTIHEIGSTPEPDGNEWHQTVTLVTSAEPG